MATYVTDPLDHPKSDRDRVDEILRGLAAAAKRCETAETFYADMAERAATIAVERIAIWKATAESEPLCVWDSRAKARLCMKRGLTRFDEAGIAWEIASCPNGPTSFQLEPSDAGESIAAVSMREVVWSVIGSGKPAHQEPTHQAQSGRTDYPFPGGGWLVVPWLGSDGQHGAISMGLSVDAVWSVEARYLPVAAAMAEIVSDFQNRLASIQLRRRLEIQSRVEAFAKEIHLSLDLTQAAFRIANDGRTVCDCDRLSVVVRGLSAKSRWRVQAISGADKVHRHSPAAAELARLCNVLAPTGQVLWYGRGGEELPPQIESALDDYLDASPAVALCVVPLYVVDEPNGDEIGRDVEGGSEPKMVAATSLWTNPQEQVGAGNSGLESANVCGAGTSQTQQMRSRPFGFLIFENFHRQLDDTSRLAIGEMVDHSQIALTHALRVQAIPLSRMWMSLSRQRVWSRCGSPALIASLVVMALAVGLIAIPATVQVRIGGELQPVVRQEIFAPSDAVVTAVHVDHGQTVVEGQTLLELRSTELDLAIQQVDGEMGLARNRLAAVRSEKLQLRPSDPDSRLRQQRLSAEEDQQVHQVQSLERQKAMLNQQSDQLVVRAPVAGTVLTWNAQQRLAARPLRRGETLLTVADTEGLWQVEMRVPSRLAGRIIAAQKAIANNPDQFAQTATVSLTTDPGRSIDAQITKIADRMTADDSGEMSLVVIASVDRHQIEHPVAGTTAIIRVDCGRGTLAEAWFYDLIDAIRLRLPF